MPSRRAVLAGAGGLALAGVGGAAAWSRSVGTGRLYHKSVSVLDERNGRRYGFSVATLLYAGSSGRVVGDTVGSSTRTSRRRPSGSARSSTTS